RAPLDDAALFIKRLRAPHEVDGDTEHALMSLKVTLENLAAHRPEMESRPSDHWCVGRARCSAARSGSIGEGWLACWPAGSKRANATRADRRHLGLRHAAKATPA